MTRNFTQSHTWGDYQRDCMLDAQHDRLEAARDGRTDINLDRVPSGGGDAARWAMDERIPEFVNFGDHIFDYDLAEIANRCGVNVAASVDELCKPCEVCGLHTYGGGICNQCESVEMARSNRGPVVTAELAGAFTPRCDF